MRIHFPGVKARKVRELQYLKYSFQNRALISPSITIDFLLGFVCHKADVHRQFQALEISMDMDGTFKKLFHQRRFHSVPALFATIWF